jgi:hypothetical protein
VLAAGCTKTPSQHERYVGRAAALHLLALICADALETMLTSWYATPGKVAWNAAGAISAR